MDVLAEYLACRPAEHSCGRWIDEGDVRLRVNRIKPVGGGVDERADEIEMLTKLSFDCFAFDDVGRHF
jgi:hypothetical protein